METRELDTIPTNVVKRKSSNGWTSNEKEQVDEVNLGIKAQLKIKEVICLK